MTTAAEGTPPAPRWRAREATPADYEQILAINWEILVETAGQKTAGFSRRLWEWQYLQTEERSLISVADDHGTIAGYMHGLRFPYRYRGQRIIASTSFWLLGKGANYSGKVEFSDSETKAK